MLKLQTIPVFLSSLFRCLCLYFQQWPSQPLPSPIYQNRHRTTATASTATDNLYYLHDTGKYFCLNELPMACVDCHGGDPQATIMEEGHTLRTAHPVINEDISKCQQCHPNNVLKE